MISEFELQTQSGQLWPDIVEHFAAKDALVQAAQSETIAVKDALALNIKEQARLVAAADAEVLALEERGADCTVLRVIVGMAKATPREREKEAKRAEYEAAQAAADALKAALDALAAPAEDPPE